MSDIAVLVVDDERNLVRSIQYSLGQEGLDVAAAYSGAEGIAKLAEISPDVVLLDLGLTDMSGLQVLEHIAETTPGVPVIMISAHGDTRMAVKAVKRGAVDYLTKPFDTEELVLLIRRSVERARLVREVEFHRERERPGGDIVGQSAPIAALRRRIERIGKSSAHTVLVGGPSGTGKALVARALHQYRFADAPFVEVNCAALPEQLIEAELFGAQKGAYTGADRRRAGLIELADGGTLFLDEIGELPLALQAKVLTFLENRTFRPVGSARERSAEVFVVAATNRDLRRDVAAGNFRKDLFYRLNVIPMEVPALAERQEDIALLLQYFISRFATHEACAPITLSAQAEQALLHHDWPGNVRELKNLIERLTILYPGQVIPVRHLPPEIASETPVAPVHGDDLHRNVEGHERALILRAMEEVGGRKGLAAEKLGISRHALKRRMQRLKIGEYRK